MQPKCYNGCWRRKQDRWGRCFKISTPTMFLDCCQSFFCIPRRKLAGWSNLVTFCRKLPSCGVGSEEVLFCFPTIFTIYIFLVCFIILKIPFCCALSFWQYLVQWSPRCANASDSGEIVECHHRYNMCYKAFHISATNCNSMLPFFSPYNQV